MPITPRGFLVKSPAACVSPPKYGLLASTPVITLSDPHWQASGIEWEDYLCGDGLEAFVDACPPVTGFTKAAQRDPQFCAADPFVVVGSYECPPVGRPSNEAFEIARKRLLTWESHQVEEAFWTGVVDSAAGTTTINPSLAFGNDECGIEPVLVDAGIADIVKSISLMEEALGDTIACGGTIHVPYSLAAFMAKYSLLHEEDGVYYTPTGSKVIAGHGYPGTGPANAAAGDDQAWIFGTGPLTVVQGGIIMTPSQIQEAVDRTINNVTVRAEKFFAVGFSCAVLALQVCLDSVDCE